MGRAGGYVHAATSTEIIALCQSGRSVVVTGGNGSGKSMVLREVAAAFRARGTTVSELHSTARAAHERVAKIGADSVLVIDDFEQASPELVRAALLRTAAGAPTVLATLAGSQRTRPLHQLTSTDTAPDSLCAEWNACVTVRVEPLSAGRLERFIHEQSPHLVDADMVHCVVQLAEGRPAWALDLLRLAELGLLASIPRPNIIEAPLPEDEFPALRSLTDALGDLSPEAAGAAIGLAGLPPFDLPGARDLVGAAHISELAEHGALFRVASSESFYVPAFVAAALRVRTSPETITRWQLTVAEHAVQQEALGLPLTEAETLLGARFLPTDPTLQDDTELHAARVRIVHRAAKELNDFFDPAQTRTLVLRAGKLAAPLRGFDQIRAVYALAGAEAALGELETHRHADSLEDPYVTEWYAALLAAEAGTALPERDLAGSRAAVAAADLADAALVFRLWNTLEFTELTSPEFLRVRREHPVPEVRFLATALSDLHAVWEGRLPSGSWLATGATIPTPYNRSSEFARTVSGTLLLAHALIAFLAGEQSLRAQEFRAAARRIPPGDAHARWMRHLLATGEAVICGNMRRGTMEWERLLRTIPRMIPRRLRTVAELMGFAVGAPVPGALSEDPPPQLLQRVHRYFSGAHDALGSGGRAEIAPHLRLPMVRIASDHLNATSAQNPNELLRVAARLHKVQLWAPAAYAITSARTIFLGRRAVRNVRICDDWLADIDAQLRAQVPWYRSGDLPTVTRVHLTPREQATALLAAEGLTNAEIAQDLSCSIRTVESHVAQAKAKLGAASRTDLRDHLETLRASSPTRTARRLGHPDDAQPAHRGGHLPAQLSLTHGERPPSRP